MSIWVLRKLVNIHWEQDEPILLSLLNPNLNSQNVNSQNQPLFMFKRGNYAKKYAKI